MRLGESDRQPATGAGDEELWTGLRAGIETDFATLFRRHNKAVYNFAFRATASWSMAEDITQATFATLWRRARQGTVEPLRRDSAVPILLAMARHEVLNNVRSNQRRLRLVHKIEDQGPGYDNNVSDWVDQEASMARVRLVLNQLPENQRAVIELVVWSGLDMAACAEVLKVPVGTVKSRLNRARKKLATTEVATLLGGEAS
ncbi:MAG: sigma-70 family RNA polymerase sigma factor [Propionibacteriaceae bacterium]|nr:sigma-70 family RNA polymerase sigma factor [Propionibacteriaceae bacterium]